MNWLRLKKQMESDLEATAENGFQRLHPGVARVILPAGTVITPELLANQMTFGVVATEGKLTFEDVLVSLRQVESAGSPGDAAFLRSLGIEP